MLRHGLQNEKWLAFCEALRTLHVYDDLSPQSISITLRSGRLDSV